MESACIPSSKPRLVFVHGACHGAWCWYKIRKILEDSDYRVTCIDLKGAGINMTDPNTVFTMDEHDEPLFCLLSDLPPDEKVVLIGHSAGGLSLTHAIHTFPEKIKMAVYIAANMLKHGFSTDEDRKDGSPDLSQYGEVNELIYALGPDKPPTSVIPKKEFLRQIYYNLSPPEDATLASMLLRPAPLMALSGAKYTDGPEDDNVPRVYVKTLEDKALKQEQQDAMIRRWPPCQVYALESDHCPFFSTPDRLFHVITKVIASLKH